MLTTFDQLIDTSAKLSFAKLLTISIQFLLDPNKKSALSKLIQTDTHSNVFHTQSTHNNNINIGPL